MDRAEERDYDGAVAQLDRLKLLKEALRSLVADHEGVQDAARRWPLRVEVPAQVQRGERSAEVGERPRKAELERQGRNAGQAECVLDGFLLCRHPSITALGVSEWFPLVGFLPCPSSDLSWCHRRLSLLPATAPRPCGHSSPRSRLRGPLRASAGLLLSLPSCRRQPVSWWSTELDASKPSMRDIWEASPWARGLAGLVSG